MSKHKIGEPCQNQGCESWSIDSPDQCSAWPPCRDVTQCHKYQGSAILRAKTFIPKLPDKYTPGCMRKTCGDYCEGALCNCVVIQAHRRCHSHHEYACENVLCYSPATKPLSIKRAIEISMPEDKWLKLDMHVNGVSINFPCFGSSSDEAVYNIEHDIHVKVGKATEVPDGEL